MTMQLQCYVEQRWVSGVGQPQIIKSAIDGTAVASIDSTGIDMASALAFARKKGGAALRKLTFHQRADLVKRIAQVLTEKKDALYQLSYLTGATKADSWIDIDGGIGTAFVMASKGKRELPNERFALDGEFEPLSRSGQFGGRHVYLPREGVCVHINAFNFPVWGMLEKLAPAIIAGMPVITKPASATAYLAEEAVKIIVAADILPAGALQFIAGSTQDLLEHLTAQDMVGFTGSMETSMRLQAHPVILRNAVPFVAERDSLNCSILGPDAGPDEPEFSIFIREAAKEMTVKAGQKCTAIRRILVPAHRQADVIAALSKRLQEIRIGDPRLETTRMGPLASQDQRNDVRNRLSILQQEADVVFGNPEEVAVDGADSAKGAFLSPILLHARNAKMAVNVHEVEAFGPVATVLGYDDTDQAIDLARRGGGSLAGSIVTNDANFARDMIFGMGAHHGRLLILDRHCAKESTGHGSPMPHLIHGGPGRAGGGEELGGVRAIKHHMQRVAIQGSPTALTSALKSWIKGAPETQTTEHPFRYNFHDLAIGQTFRSGERTVTLDDIEHFAHFTGDTFYAHMDEDAVKDHPFFPGRVAHGYLLLAFAAGLFVEPARGPVLANYGLDNLRFLKPVQPGEAIQVRLTAKSKSARNAEYGEVRWDVEITNAAGDTCATYDLLTMNAMA